MAETRHDRLQQLADDYHASRHGDYDDMYEAFAERYGLRWNDDDAEVMGVAGIPRFASLANDETYGHITLFETATEAVQNQAAIPYNGETLNHPCGVVDLDTGERVEYVMVALTKDTADALAGIVACGTEQMTEDVTEGGDCVYNHQGIFTDWEELRTVFPIENFKRWVENNPWNYDDAEQGYDPEFGF